MGRRKPYVDQELTFAPKISKTSKRIALRQSEHLETKGVPRFMKGTKSKKLTLEPITSVPLTHKSIEEVQSPRTVSANDPLDPEHALVLSRSTVLPTLSPDISRAVGKMNGGKLAVTGAGAGEGLKTVDPFNNAMSKNVYLPPRSIQLDENVFTFRPKVSSASAKIAESLGTDFMSRQQMHLEKQRRLVSFSFQLFNICHSLSLLLLPSCLSSYLRTGILHTVYILSCAILDLHWYESHYQCTQYGISYQHLH